MLQIAHMHDFIYELPHEIRRIFESRSRVVSFKKGEYIYRQGEDANAVYRLLKGSIQMVSYGIDGKEFVAVEFRDGDCFGEMGVLDGMQRVSNTLAMSDVSLQMISANDFHDMLEKHPEFSKSVLRCLCRRQRLSATFLSESVALSLPQRLALMILRMALAHGQTDERGASIVPTSQEDLGRRLGSSRQTVNKALSKLAEDGVLDLSYSKICVLDMSRLMETYSHLTGMEHVAPIYPDDESE